ncbi:NAD(P)/FAD-dependent oxidoreductase [Hymenobacter metallicola]|uniref:NAD(P)/FAD-dependent oxidoreductase n=1 Tax=Hymenobacter metallicola TaxID=2563114 RepID=A0A4Z0QDS7_9BACT|nr:NAD(P)/FAD-dependent oxidoreductase [Hymenobacter metallicola]TGE27646.1 NAD(P)/FAD-dependent oxidoreductase [Hymenobacter metallicola]
MPHQVASLPRRHAPAQPTTDYDVVIIGAGSAGLSAALTLGRALRRVMVCNGGAPRNAPSPGVHSFFTRDGIKPAELLQTGLQQLQPYETVEVRTAQVTQLRKQTGLFELVAEGETGRSFTVTARKVLLATGVEDELPPIDGMRDLWGRGVLHCPYCHGWEVRNQPIAIYGRGKIVTGMALLVSRWTTDVIVCTDGAGHLSENARRRLRQQKIKLREDPISHLEGKPNGELRHIVFENGEKLARYALFVHPHQHQRFGLLESLGCRLTSKGAVWVNKHAQTSVGGLYAAGDITPGPQKALLAAAEGMQAAIAIHEALTREECPK